MNLPVILTKVKAIVATFVLACLATAGVTLAGVDWNGFGPYGPLVGILVSAVVAYLKRDKWIVSVLARMEDYRDAIESMAPETDGGPHESDAPVEPGVGA